jgi:hypothetical protein
MRYVLIILFFSTFVVADDYNATINAQTLGLYYQDYNFLMALSGVLVGFVLLSTVAYITILVTTSRS